MTVAHAVVELVRLSKGLSDAHRLGPYGNPEADRTRQAVTVIQDGMVLVTLRASVGFRADICSAREFRRAFAGQIPIELMTAHPPLENC